MNQLILHPSFLETLKEIKKINLNVIHASNKIDFDFSKVTFPQNGKIRNIEDLNKISLNAKNGQNTSKKYLYSAYDESKLNYSSLEGNAYFISHSIVHSIDNEYMPVTLLSFYFYTKSSVIIKNCSKFRSSIDHKADSNRDYAIDRNDFLKEWSIENTILLIDGPLIGGNLSSYTIDLVHNLHDKDIIPIFIVKNSESNLVTDNIKKLENKFNSDMHWSYNILNVGQRTNFLLYVDEYNPNNAKIFCYLKTFNLSPQRIEFHIETYEKHNEVINDIMDMIYFLMLVHGDKKNPQVRPIAIAEKYAREILKMSDSYNLIKYSGLIPTMNQERFEG